MYRLCGFLRIRLPKGFVHYSVGDSEAAVAAEVVGEKFLNVHHRGEVFAAEPPLAPSAVGEARAEVA